MISFAIILFTLFVLMSAGQFLLVSIYTRRFRSYRLPEVPDAVLPKAAVILCLRGEDPFLEECLERLARQIYPRFSIRIVLDGPDDPARRRVEQWVAKYRELPVSVEFLKYPFATCTLYCSSIHQAVRGLDDSIEAIAFVNADTMVHPDWLRALMTPLLDERIGAVTGNRWYFPATGRMGSLVRYVQNATAVLVMYFLDLIWGGSLALKRQVFGHARFLEQLCVASCEDCAVHTVLKATGLRLSFSPAVMMVNREECDVGSAFRFIRRQMVWTRLYHAGWATVVRATVLAAAVVLAATAAFWADVALGQWAVAGWILGGTLVLILANLAIVAFLHRTIGQRVAQEQGEAISCLPMSAFPKLLVALPLSFFVYLGAILSASVVRRIDWRGVLYQVIPPRGVRLVEYRKFQQADARIRAGMSV